MGYEGPGRYRHYKGGHYHVLGLALQENTVFKPHDLNSVPGNEVIFVIYMPLSLGSLLENRVEDYWARDLMDFNGTIMPVGKDPMPRFQKIRPEAHPE